MTTCPETFSVTCSELTEKCLYNYTTMVQCSSNREKMLCHSASRNLGPIVLIHYCLLHLNLRMFHWSNEKVPACVWLWSHSEVTERRESFMASKSRAVKQLACYSVGFWQREMLTKQFKNGNGLFQANMLSLIIYGVSEHVYHDNTHVKHQRATRSVLSSLTESFIQFRCDLLSFIDLAFDIQSFGLTISPVLEDILHTSGTLFECDAKQSQTHQ